MVTVKTVRKHESNMKLQMIVVFICKKYGYKLCELQVIH